MKRLLAVLVLLSVSFIAPGAVGAQSGESISSFTVTASIDENAQATITETIIYDFGSNERRGIFRDIPERYYVDDGSGYALDVRVTGIQRDGSADDFTYEDRGPDYLTVRIGDPDVYITGEHTYTISYVLGPVAITAEGGAEIVRLDVPGPGWEVPVKLASVSAMGPIRQTSSTCYEGVIGGTDTTCRQNGEASYTNSRALTPGETLTIELEYPAGTFTGLAELQDFPSGPGVVGFSIMGVIGAIASFFGGQQIIGRWRYRQRRKQEVVYARYEPPKDIGPAEIGLLVDNSSSGAELSATIIDLAIHGFFKITQEKEKKWYRKAKYSFTRSDKDAASLKSYEQDVLNALFEGKSTNDTSSLSTSTKFAKANEKFHKALKENLENHGFYKKVNVFRPNLANRMSDEGYTKWAEIEGFREFLKVTEKDRMAFHDAPEKKPEQFSEYLAYAVALGVEEQWAKQFDSLDVRVDDWYQGSSAVNTYILASHISSLSSGLNQVSAAANRSSGSSGAGGGFSGGGFSGGGGGSW